MGNISQDQFNASVATEQWRAYGKSLKAGYSAEDAIAIGHATAQEMRNERALQNAAERSDTLRPHAATIAQSIMRVLRRGKGAAVVALIAGALLVMNAPHVHAGTTYDPRGYRRCRFSEIQADPLHKACRVATWSEARNSGYIVTFRAYVRKLRPGERQQ